MPVLSVFEEAYPSMLEFLDNKILDRNNEVKKKLLLYTPFPILKMICRLAIKIFP